MARPWKISASCLLLLLSAPILAQDRPLLTPLSAGEEKSARAQNLYFIGRETYYAKRYRIVNVDPALLESRQRISIPTFGDDKLIVKFEEYQVDDATPRASWFGRLVQNRFSEADFVEHIPGNPAIAKELFDNATVVRLSIDFYERDEETGANLNPVYTFREALQENQIPYAERTANPKFIRGVSGQFRSAERAALYRLKPLGMGGNPYHILVEVDEKKLNHQNSGDDAVRIDELGNTVESEEGRRQREEIAREYNEHMQSFGNNPHDELYERRLGRTTGR